MNCFFLRIKKICVKIIDVKKNKSFWICNGFWSIIFVFFWLNLFILGLFVNGWLNLIDLFLEIRSFGLGGIILIIWCLFDVFVMVILYLFFFFCMILFIIFVVVVL